MAGATFALIVVDVQNDFCPGGALAVKDGDKIIPALNTLVEAFTASKLPVCFTRDWHPPDHCSFRENGGPWPSHCVRNSKGAEFHPDLRVPKNALVVSKATEPDKEAYSGFQGTDLSSTLKRMGVTELFVGGLATDYCVKNTVGDALEEGFLVNVLTDCVRGVNLKRTDSANALKWMKVRGAKEMVSEGVLKMINRRATVLSSS